LAGNKSEQTVHFRVQRRLKPSVSYALCASSSLFFENATTVHGSVASEGTSVAQNAVKIFGDMFGQGSTTLSNSAEVSGTLYAGGSYSILNNAKVTNGVQPLPASFTGCGSYPLESQFVLAESDNDNAQLATETFAPHWDGHKLIVRNGATIVLPTGRYLLDELQLLSNGTLVAADGASVELFVKGNISVTSTALLGNDPASGKAILVVSKAQADAGTSISIRNHSDARLVLYAPLADVALENNSAIIGAVVGKNVTLRNNQSMQFKSP